ncbi:MAG: TAXI family TRAP transporter solute-binding subunit [Litoreibacter sp.]
MRNTCVAAISAVVLLVTQAAAQEQTVKMATIAPSLSQALVMSTFANIVTEKLDDVTVEVSTGGAATVHALEVGRGNGDLAMITPIMYQLMTKGERMYKKQPDAPEASQNVRLLTWFPGGPFHFAVRGDSDIKVLDDLVGASAFMGPLGGGAYNTATGWVSATTGLEPEKNYKVIKASWQTGFQAFLDGKIDVYAVGCIDPCPQFIQFAETETVRFLSPEDAEGESVTKFLGKYRTIKEIPTGIYKNQVDDVPAVTQSTFYGIAVRADMDDELVYQMTKAFWDNIGGITSKAPWAEALSLEAAAVDHGVIELHPGAARYFKEAGAM